MSRQSVMVTFSCWLPGWPRLWWFGDNNICRSTILSKYNSPVLCVCMYICGFFPSFCWTHYCSGGGGGGGGGGGVEYEELAAQNFCCS